MESSPISAQHLLDLMPVNLAVLAKDYRIIWANPAWENAPHLPCQPQSNQPCYERHHRSRPCPGCPVPLALDTGEAASGDVLLETPDAEPARHWRLRAQPLPAPASHDILVMAVDIQDEKQIQQALCISEKRLKEAQKLAKVGHWELQLPSQRLHWSDEIYRIFEIPRQDTEITYELFLSVAHPEDRPRIHEAYRKSVEQGEAYSIDHRLKFPDGRIKYVHERGITEYDGRGNPTRSMGTVQDITERKLAELENKKLQEKFTQAMKMESIGRLAGGIAHDFNNMLAVIFGNLDMIHQEEIPLPAQVSEPLEQLQSAAERSADLTRQLLAFARCQPISPKVINLNTTVDQMLKLLCRVIGEDIDLDWKPAEDIHEIYMDTSQVDQILVNLCANARDAISGVGKITIETRNNRFDKDYCDANPGFLVGEYVMLGVSDDGCGMDPETRSCLFEPFYTTKPADQGTGLGLSTVYGIVRQNNGFINVYSEPGRGSSFHLYFARHTQGSETAPDAPRRVNEPLGHNETILLVEDEPLFLDVGKAMLTHLGYQVLTADGPARALDISQTHPGPIHLIVTDVILPDMDGVRLSEKLQKAHPGIPTLFISGYPPNVIDHHNILQKEMPFLQKPFSREELAVKVRELLDRPPASEDSEP